ncbi:hypothetical protein H5J25_13960 [Sphingomonas aliaeris]|uniref:Uncharacterized protein n=1 Tax=Sphingomonas aliaeris TaxID=2759526 RepID=A0A974NTB9_9SPHN|nr:hypothetical protein [Sphingomonas aliaeris]QQV76547.1 hypothetical protein H5J25_13960 [Sphingomonas aliaeris]
MLVRHSDKHSAESVYSDILSDTFTAHAKGAAEGGETGVHIFLSLAPEAAIPNRYTCIIEKAAGISVTTIRRFLNRLIHDEYDEDPTSFSYPHPGGQRTRAGKVAMERCLPRLEIDGRPSQRLADDVQNGRLTGIVLKRAVPHTPVGGVPFITQKEATLRLEIDQGHLTANIWGDVRRALAAEAGTYPSAQIGIKLPARKKTVSLEVDTATGSPLNEMYFQSFDVVNINPRWRSRLDRWFAISSRACCRF